VLLGSIAQSSPLGTVLAARAGLVAASSQARLIATELEKTKGWKIIPQNVTGKGGAVMARKLKSQPNDGLTIGIAVTETGCEILTPGVDRRPAVKPA